MSKLLQPRTSLNLVMKSFPISVSSQCNIVHVIVMLCKVNVKAVGDKSWQVREVLAVLRWQNNCCHTDSLRLQNIIIIITTEIFRVA